MPIKKNINHPILKELQEVADFTAKFLGINFNPTVNIRDQQKGRTDSKTKSVIIPLWAINEGDVYAWAYTIHEVNHYACNNWGHSKSFKDKERRVLAEFNLFPVYKKAYACELKSKSGQTIWKQYW